MDMEVHNGLPGSRPAVDTDVVSVRVEPVVQQKLGLFQETVYRRSFLFSAVKKVGYMAAGDNQQMPWIDRKSVKSGPGQPVFKDYFLLSAEGAFP